MSKWSSLNEWSPKRNTFEMLEPSLLKVSSSVLWSLLKTVSLLFEKIGSMKKVVDSCFKSTTIADRT